MKGVLYTDGASFSNPGPAGIGCTLSVDDVEVATIAEPIGIATNNEAEWQALVAGMKLALDHGVTDLLVRMDSQLVERQFNGQYKVKQKHLQGYLIEAKRLSKEFESLTVEHVRREFNVRADELSKAGAEAN